MEAAPHLFIVAAVLLTGFAVGLNVGSTSSDVQAKPMQYEAQDFSGILGMKGLSDTMINNHFKLYQGYVKNTNMLMEKLAAVEPDATNPEYAELRRRFGFEFDGMRLHEMYFENLGGKGTLDEKSPLAKRIAEDFGSVDAWKKDFVATGMMRGVGWVILYQDPTDGRLINFWIGEHQNNHPAGCRPILVMDVWEHAYMTDYQLERKSYIQAFWDNINWDAATGRYMQVKK